MLISMRTTYRLLLFWIPALLSGACFPSPTDNALGWNGRGMVLPDETGAAGNPGGGGAAAGMGEAGAGTGAAGANPGAGAGGNRTDAGGSGGSTATGGIAGTGTGGNGGGGGASSLPSTDAGTPASGSPLGASCHLDVVVTTHSGGGSHAPKNVDAIWTQDASGKFIKSLYVMARNQIQHLDAWNAATTAAGLSRNRVDAVTGATLPSYGTRMASWNCTDVNEKVVDSGGYQVCFDLNDGNGSDKHTCDNITLGTTATTVMPPDALPCFTGQVLTYTP
jgi:hypothetical protein